MCKQKCPNICPHGYCARKCCEKCVDCVEKCVISCEHRKCDKLCYELCDIGRCNEPCKKKLKCGHKCIGICGERCAISNAIAHKSNKFKAIAIVGDKNNIKEPPFKDYAYPCGICRQALSEFGGENLIVIIAKSETDYLLKKLIEILPYIFTKENLK